MIRFVGMGGLGLLIGVLSGLFGVGGGFLLVPMLNVVFNIAYNTAVGSSLCQMIGTSLAASLRHRNYGNVDFKLALFFILGSIGGAESGARILMWLKESGEITIHGLEISRMYLWINIIYVCLLTLVGVFMFFESSKAKRRMPKRGVVDTDFSRSVQSLKIPPYAELRIADIENISIWILLVLGFTAGVLSGLLGVGGGFVITPAMIYLIGVPTGVAIGTGLFQIIFISAYGSFSHFMKGNVDFLIVGSILAGSLGGSQIGVIINKKIRAAHIRYYFSWLVFISIVIIILKFLFVVELL